MMGGNSRLGNIPASNRDGVVFKGNSNGQRSNFLNTSNLDRSSSSRQGQDNLKPGGSNGTRGVTSTNGDHIFLSQFLAHVQTQAATFNSASIGAELMRHFELRKVTNNAHVIKSESSLARTKPLSALGTEELKRMRSCLYDNSFKARGRARIYSDAISKLDSYHSLLSSKKRPHNEISGNGNMVKAGQQAHQTSSSVDLLSKGCNNEKPIVPNKKARTNIRLENPANILSKPVTGIREREMSRPSGYLSQSDEKDKLLPASVKGKRSTVKSSISIGAMASRTVDGDQDIKPSNQQRPTSCSGLRMNESHSSRYGSIPGLNVAPKVESSSVETSLGVDTIPRNNHNNSNPSDRRDCSATLEKDRPVVKATLKQTLSEESHTTGSLTMVKGKASRAPRSNSAASPCSSLHGTPPVQSSNGGKQSTFSNNIQLPGSFNNHKRSLPSQAVPQQCGGQRSTKISRRRTNLATPLVSLNEVAVVSEGSPRCGLKSDSTESNAILLSRDSLRSGGSQQSKLKSENVSSVSLSESEESGAGENKCKEKNKKTTEVKEKLVPVPQKVTPFVLQKKRKVLLKEGGGKDGVCRQARSGRGFVPVKAARKQENVRTTNQLRSNQTVSNRGEVKSGKPPNKKISSDCKPLTQPKNIKSEGSFNFTGESEDDHEELLSAMKAAINASDAQCSGSFWKQMEPYFADLTQDDLVFLKKQLQINESEDKETVLDCASGTDQNGKANLKTGVTSFSNSTIESNKTSVENEEVDCDTLNNSNVEEILLRKYNFFERVMSISQMLLSALIAEEDIKEVDMGYGNDYEDELAFGPYNHIGWDSGVIKTMDSEVESKLEFSNKKLYLADDPFSVSQAKLNGDKKDNLQNSNRGYTLHEDKFAVHSDVESCNPYVLYSKDRNMNEYIKDRKMSPSACGYLDSTNNYLDYEHMSLDSKILLELRSIELCPDYLPNLTHGDQEVTEDLSMVQEELQLQASKNKHQICKLEKIISKECETETRRREVLAMNQLVEKAYEKHLIFQSINPSVGKSNGKKLAKQASLAFAKRTLARCCKFDETGKSCFSEMICSLSSEETTAKSSSNTSTIATTNICSLPVSDIVKTSVSALEDATVLKKIENQGQEKCDTPDRDNEMVDISELFVASDTLDDEEQDFWLGMDVDALQDPIDDIMGLDVPMDDLSDLALV